MPSTNISSTYPFLYLFICPFICQPILLSFFPSFCSPTNHLPICAPTHLSGPPVYLPIYPSIHSSIHLCHIFSISPFSFSRQVPWIFWIPSMSHLCLLTPSPPPQVNHLGGALAPFAPIISPFIRSHSLAGTCHPRAAWTSQVVSCSGTPALGPQCSCILMESPPSEGALIKECTVQPGSHYLWPGGSRLTAGHTFAGRRDGSCTHMHGLQPG